MEDRYNYYNTEIVRSINSLGVGRIYPYKHNLIKNLYSEHIPDYFFTGKIPKSKNITKLTANNLVKIFDLNKKVKTIIDKIQNRFILPGKNIAHIDNYIYEQFCKNNIYPSIFGYENFPKSSCISINHMICHCIPYNYILHEGDLVTVDVCGYNGFHTDIANTYIVPGSKTNYINKKLVNTNWECLQKAIEICKPGQLYNNIGKIVEKHATENGFNVLTNFNGHGIGKQLHMDPTVYNFKRLIPSGIEMKVGDMFTIEPLLTQGKNAFKVLPDNTSVITADHKMSSHFERTILITENEHLVLN